MSSPGRARARWPGGAGPVRGRWRCRGLLVLGLVGQALADPPPPWVEREGATLRITADVRGWFTGGDAEAQQLRGRLTSGLTTTLAFAVEVRDDGGAVRARAERVARVRWHLWDEHFTAALEGLVPPRQPQSGPTLAPPTYASLGALVDHLARFEAVPIALNLAADERVHRVVVGLDINPVTAEESARMRQWLTSPTATATLDPLSGTLLGSFVRFFDNLKPSAAEDRRALTGPWFRGDRLPWFKPAGARP